MFNNLGHIIDIAMLEQQFKELGNKKAIWIDGITKTEYGKNLEANRKAAEKYTESACYKAKIENAGS